MPPITTRVSIGNQDIKKEVERQFNILFQELPTFQPNPSYDRRKAELAEQYNAHHDKLERVLREIPLRAEDRVQLRRSLQAEDHAKEELVKHERESRELFLKSEIIKLQVEIRVSNELAASSQPALKRRRC